MPNVNFNPAPGELAGFFSQALPCYLYILGGLNNKFDKDTLWYTLEYEGRIKAAALLNTSEEIPLLIALAHENTGFTMELLEKTSSTLPDTFYAYTALHTIENKPEFKIIRNYGRFYQMYLHDTPSEIEDRNIRRLSENDLTEIEAFYSLAYPDNFFSPSMLREGYYLGYYENNILAGIAGTSIFSICNGISSLGNIAVHPLYRNRHIATGLVSALCRALLARTPHIGLSVHIDNLISIRIYQKLGFVIADEYEYMLVSKATQRQG